MVNALDALIVLAVIGASPYLAGWWMRIYLETRGPLNTNVKCDNTTFNLKFEKEPERKQ